jgi:hypothetical protein
LRAASTTAPTSLAWARCPPMRVAPQHARATDVGHEAGHAPGTMG